MNIKSIIFGVLILALGASLLFLKEKHFLFKGKKLSNQELKSVPYFAVSLLIAGAILLLSGCSAWIKQYIFPWVMIAWFIGNAIMVRKLQKNLTNNNKGGY